MCQKWVQHATPPKFTQIFPKIFPQNFPKWLFQQGKLYKIMINHSWSLLIETSQPRNIPLWKKHKNTFCVKKTRTKLRGTLFSDNSILLLQISHHPSKCWTRLCRSVGADGRVQIQRGAHPSHARCRLVAGCPLKPLFNYETWAARVHDFVNDILIWSHFLCKNNTRFFKVFSGCYFISFVHWSNAEAKQQAIDLRVEQVPNDSFEPLAKLSSRDVARSATSWSSAARCRSKPNSVVALWLPCGSTRVAAFV